MKKIRARIALMAGALALVSGVSVNAFAQIAGVNAAIDAQRDFWIAETDLQAAITGTGGSSISMASTAAATEAAAGH